MRNGLYESFSPCNAPCTLASRDHRRGLLPLPQAALQISEGTLPFSNLVPTTVSFFLPFETEFLLCHSGWSAMARSRLIATSTPWVQAILLPQTLG